VTSQPSPPIPPTVAVGSAIQNLVAARLGRGFAPLALLCLVGLGEMLAGVGSGWLLAVGAPLTAGAMLAYGMRVVQRAFGRPARLWMRAAVASSLLPPVFGVYVLGWRGLRAAAAWEGLTAGLGGIFLAALGAWTLRAWLRLLEVRRLAEVMTAGGFEPQDTGS
jgi:hypothetical protein